MYWFESYMDQALTFTSWKKIEGKLCQQLKKKLEKKLMDPVNRQLLFQILGDEFVNKYFPSYNSSPAILDNVRPEEKEKKMTEMKSFVASVIDDTVQKKDSKSASKIQSDFLIFSSDMKKMIHSDLSNKESNVKSKKKEKNDLPEKYLGDIMSYDPSVIHYILPALQKQVIVLSDSLRSKIWPACILTKEKSKNVKNLDKVKEKFVQLYNKQHGSELEESILSAVEKFYGSTPCLKSLNSEDNQISTATILNVCHTYGKKFKKDYVPYAAVVQQIYLKKSKYASGEDFAMASMMTERVLRLGAMNREKSSKVADKVVEDLTEVDKGLFDHISSTLADEQDKKSGKSSSESDLSSKKEIAFFISKWIVDGFVSFLKPTCLFFVWDQLFFHNWETETFHTICMALLGLLKPWFMHSRDKVSQVFNEEPGYLYLLDLRKAVMHLQKKKKFSDIPSMNRNIKYAERVPTPPPPRIPMLPPPRVPTPPLPKEPTPPPPKEPTPPPPKEPTPPPPKEPTPPPPKEPTPPPPKEPTPPPPKEPTPPPPKVPTPPPPSKSFIPWVPYQKLNSKEVPLSKSKLDFPFDLYIDAVRFVPDNATYIKLTGKILNMFLNNKDESIKLQAYPELDSPWRYPDFKLKQTVNLERNPMNPDVVIMMRIYTIEKHSKKNYVLGSCLFGPFSNKHGKQATLRTGGHQVRVRQGIPDPDFTVEHMLASHMDDNPLVPGLTILLRVLPHSKDYVNAPRYETNVYRSSFAKPNESENKLYKHYQETDNFAMTVRDVTLQTAEKFANDNSLKQHIRQTLLKEGVDVEDFPYQRYVNYDKEHGIQLLADKASGLPIFLEGRYLQCLVQFYPGQDSRIGNGMNQVSSFVTENLELDSPQRAPDWSDQPKRVKAKYDDKAFILVTLYGLRPIYDVTMDKVVDKEGREPRFNLEHAVAWSVTRCFDLGAVFAGTHHVPLLKGRPPDELMDKLAYLPLDDICKKFKTQVKVFESASIEISVWDGHFSNSECPPLPVLTNLLNISPNPSKYIKAAERRTGASVGDLLKQGLNNPSDYSKYKRRIVELLKEIFKTNMDEALMKAGFYSTI